MAATIKVGLDTTAIDALAKLTCLAKECKHNTINRSGVDSVGHCGYRYVSLDTDGACTMFTPKEEDK
jgi:hypothetical protein